MTMLNVILTGATGMVGEGVLLECLNSNLVKSVLVINRKASGFRHEKLKEIIHSDFNTLDAVTDQLTGFNACFFCAGVSSVGKKEEEFYQLTYTLTLNFAKALSKNPGMTFCYISGAGTDSSEKGRVMWARVKGKTENDLRKLPFAGVYNFRPGVLQPSPEQKNTLKYYKYFGWLAPVIRLIAPNSINTLKELGLAMINVAAKGYSKNIVEVSDIHQLAKQ